MDHILKTMNKGDQLLSGGSLLNIRVLIRQTAENHISNVSLLAKMYSEYGSLSS